MLRKGKVLMIVVFIGIMLFFFFHNETKTAVSDKEVETGLTMLKKQTGKKLANAQAAVEKAETAIWENTQKKGSHDQLSFSTRFANTVILGDSMAEAFLDYQLLPKNIVLAVRGRRIDNSEQELQTAVSLHPSMIFLSFGMNDLPFCRGDEKRFIRQYTKLIKRIQQQIPGVEIYVNSIIPMTEQAYAKDTVMKNDRKFNTAMRQMCKELNVTYIDNDALIDGSKSLYEQDGIHPTYPFYPAWLLHMAHVAGR